MRNDLSWFLKSEDATRIDKGDFKLNAEKLRYEYETDKEFEYIGWFRVGR